MKIGLFMKARIRFLFQKLGYMLVPYRASVEPSVMHPIVKIFGAKPPVTILDVGAFKGDFIGACLRYFPSANIHAFEAAPDTALVLESRFHGFENIKIVPSAVSDSNGFVDLFISHKDPTTNSLLGLNNTVDSTPEDRRVSVPATMLDSYVKTFCPGGIDILKIDVEGSEDRVLAGASELLCSGSVKVICIEIMFVEHYSGQALFKDILSLLTGAGYVLYDLPLLKRSSTGQLRWGDAVFIKV